MMECNKCGTDREWNYYKHQDKIYCFDCLIEALGFETYTITHYTDDCEYVACDDDIIQILEDEYGVVEIDETEVE